MRPDPRYVLAAVVVALLAIGGVGYGALHAGWAPGLAPAATAPRGEQGHVHDQYTCPMHPQVISDRPGSCPICGMDLVKKAPPAQATTGQRPGGGEPGAAGLAGVTLSPRQRVLANVETAAVDERMLGRTIEASGRVAIDESRLRQVSAWVGGRIDRLYVNTTGQVVSKGAPMASIYSPELVAAQQEYLTALKGLRELRGAPYPELADGAKELAGASRQRLRFMGVTEGQVAQLERTGRPLTSFPLVAPASGVVIDRKVQAGQYVETGAPLFDLADFSSVWVEAELFEGDLGRISAGQAAEVRVAAFPDRIFRGQVGLVLPTLQAATRTTRVRIALANPGGLLRPEMYATARIAAPVGDGRQLAVPASAVIATGRRHVVYVEVEPNRFVPRAVLVGARAGGYYPVFEGLTAGEQVAVSGGFLLDASAQLSGEALGEGSQP